MSAAVDFYSLTRDQLESLLSEQFDLPSFRATQLYKWVYQKRVSDFDQMTDIKKELRASFATAFNFPTAVVRKREISFDGTRKYLIEVDSSSLVEAVLIKQPERVTVCLSSQVGCAMGCGFCRTATMGFVRNLSTSEIIRQYLSVAQDAHDSGIEFRNIVMMGMGEPLHNYDNLIRTIEILGDEHGLDFSARKITVSTCGLVPEIKRFLKSGVRANLAISLNATTDQVRSKMMPVNKRYPIKELCDCIRNAHIKRNRTITIEYVLIADLNDSESDLRRLAGLLRGLPIKVNIVPYNAHCADGLRPPSFEKALEWTESLRSKGITVSIRRSRGADINAACGQLVAQQDQKSA